MAHLEKQTYPSLTFRVCTQTSRDCLNGAFDDSSVSWIQVPQKSKIFFFSSYGLTRHQPPWLVRSRQSHSGTIMNYKIRGECIADGDYMYIFKSTRKQIKISRDYNMRWDENSKNMCFLNRVSRKSSTKSSSSFFQNFKFSLRWLKIIIFP